MSSEAELRALETMGRILLFTPLIVGLLYLLMGASDLGPGRDGVYFAGLMMNAGLITLLYASVHRFREGKKEAESGKK